MKPMTYAGSGVDYDALDPFKRRAQLAGRSTADVLRRLGVSEVEMSRGESAYLIETPDSFLAHVEEGLGTKNLVADAMYRLVPERSFYDHIAQDTVAMIVNDMITLGALPLAVAMHLGAGSSDWFKDDRRAGDLVDGWRRACERARCAWGGGETPTLSGVVEAATVVLAGSAIGLVKPKDRLIRANIQAGDAIVVFESAGIHANGLTLARAIAERAPNGYLTPLADGRPYGEALLDPTHIYVGVIEDCLNRGVDVHYAVNVTGHGWRKLMRSPEPFAYVIDTVPTPQPVFDFIQAIGNVDDAEAYGNFNMGAGFAIYVPEKDVPTVLDVAKSFPFGASRAGHIEKSATRRVVIGPKGLEYSADTLRVR
ncbi:MAG: phosphoribosylformylglycinamidine cyclo-ligase [Acidobacteria bacterium]|nr:MAG: phosphoribosylformylglycinamidine cyclo-ligase [Acidobacteriota bacterium]